MLSNGSITPEGDYRIPITEHTLLRTDVDQELVQVERDIARAQSKLESFCGCCGQTPQDVLERYHAAVSARAGSNKARKAAQREAGNIKAENPRLEQDYAKFVSQIDLESDIELMKTEKANINEYFETQTRGYVELLEAEGFVARVDGQFELTETGSVASKIQEGPGQIIGKLVSETGKFDGFDEFELCAVLSSFAGMRIKERPHRDLPAGVTYCIERVTQLNEHFKDAELRINLSSTSPGNDICPEAASLVLAWGRASCPEECLKVKGDVAASGLFLGEFVKGILKVITLIEELLRISDNMGYIDLMARLEAARTCMMKDVATSSSLYL